ncbi:MAG: 2'-5' RNA ligase family protein, partial [Clostridia bacterium]|nr:2'-5' RNA ligase family protein [Clostridia bacterium]
MRLFVAICFTEEIKNVLLETIKKLRGQTLSGIFTDPENLHLTLAFIGESNQTAAVCSAIDACE